MFVCIVMDYYSKGDLRGIIKDYQDNKKPIPEKVSVIRRVYVCVHAHLFVQIYVCVFVHACVVFTRNVFVIVLFFHFTANQKVLLGDSGSSQICSWQRCRSSVS